MLKLKNIRKVYDAGDGSVVALQGVTLRFRKSEFVSILGQSGCGKTTLLNIIGGLDQYTAGDLVINGKSTRFFNDRDWDTYRNHSVGFVFQSYNLIPHQSVLANVELALTISGVSRGERRRRAIAALERVGLKDQIHKKPNQMSGGQMQRVAIARAIVNDPEILLADEPTGALDTATSVQIMDLLREIAKDRLVIMVTHNPDIAKEYSTRIIRLRDGSIISDSNPYAGEKRLQGESIEAYRERKAKEYRRASDERKGKKKASMSFFTALSLSFKNLMTKKARTLLTAFAGSIGIIGIALILSVSTGVQNYIDKVQEDTLSSYPITINKENADLSGLVTTLMGANKTDVVRDLDKVYESSVIFEMMNSITSIEIEENNLAAFKKFLDTNEEIRSYISAVQYSYGDGITVYTKDENGEIYRSELAALMEMASSMPGMGAISGGSDASSGMMFDSFGVWEELLRGDDGELVNGLLHEQYDVIYGEWPKNYNEIVLIVNENNEISDMALYALGLKSADDFENALKQFAMGKETELSEKSWTYEEICAHTYKMILNADLYQPDGKGGYVDISTTPQGLEYLYSNSELSTELKVVGIIRKNPDAVAGMLSSSIGYTAELTQYMIRETADSAIVKAQLANPDVDVMTGLPFAPADMPEPSATEKEAAVRAYFETLSVREKAEAFTLIASTPTQEYIDFAVQNFLASTPRPQLIEMLIAAYLEEMGGGDAEQIRAYINGLSDEELDEMLATALAPMVVERYKAEQEAVLRQMPDEQKAAMLDMGLKTEQYGIFYDSDAMPSLYSDSTYEKNLDLLYYIDGNSPTKISIFATEFEFKDKISECIERYNKSVAEEDQISYTDYVALLMSSISTVIDAISYVLIAFVAISLVVSSIMIAIITYISVLERTKEIGVLRAIGASKGDVSRVFNAETLIEGFVSGALGIGVTLLLIIPINFIIQTLSGISSLAAVLPWEAAGVLILVSMALTLFAGLIPSKLAARKDPVVALRSE